LWGTGGVIQTKSSEKEEIGLNCIRILISKIAHYGKGNLSSHKKYRYTDN